MRIPIKVLGIILLTQTFLCQLAYGNPQDSLRPIPLINKEFLVVVHVVKSDTGGRLGIDTNSIKSVIASLNPLFQPIKAKFKICEIRYIENLKFDTIDKRDKERVELLNLYQVPRRINIFYVNYLIRENGAPAGGDAQLGGIGSNSNAIVIVKNSNNLGTVGHEMGHYFSLPHTFEGNGEELADGSNCKTAGDGVCDTPADPYNETNPEAYHSGCTFIYALKDAHGDYYDPHMGNIMSYYGCGCGEFTRGQYTKMAEYYLNNNTIDW